MTKLAQWKTTALITGASSGIGLELSRLFAKDGYNLILVARSAQKLQALADELEREYGVAVTVLPADLSQAGAAREIYRRVQEKGIQVEALVNNAGFGVLEVLANAHLEDSLEMIQLNVTSLTVITQLFLPDMIQGRSGRILNVGSTGSFSPVPAMAVYAATKAYVRSFTEAIAEELRGTGVTVTALCPGVTSTGFQARSGVGGAYGENRGHDRREGSYNRVYGLQAWTVHPYSRFLELVDDIFDPVDA